MNYVVAFVLTCFESYWRRGFGGLWNDKPIIGNRFIQHVLNAIVLFLVYWYRFGLNQWWNCIIVIAVVQGLFWARGHGFAFDMGRDGQPNETMLKRYEKPLYNRWLLTPIYNVFGWTKYGYTYDLLSMMFRYTLPCLLLIPVYGYDILIMGLIVSPIYAFCWTFREKENDRYGSTALAEWIVGATTGLCLGVL